MALTQEDLQSIRAITEEVAAQKQEELAVMISKSFQKVEHYFGGMEQRLKGLDKRFDEQALHVADIKLTLTDHSLLLHRIDRRTHDQQQRLDQHEIRVRRLEKHQGLRPLPGTVDG